MQCGTAFIVLLGAACGGAAAPVAPPAPPAPTDTPAPSGPVEPEPIDSGVECAKALAACDGGICTVEVDNGCEKPVTCELAILALCKGMTETGEARGKGRGTVAAGSKDKIQAGADCEGALLVSTTVDALRCR